MRERKERNNIILKRLPENLTREEEKEKEGEEEGKPPKPS